MDVSKLLEQNLEKLSQLEAENLVFREENLALNTTSMKGRRFWMQPLETSTEGNNATWRAPPLNGESTTETDTTGGNYMNLAEYDDSYSNTDEEMQEAAAANKSKMMAYLEQVFSKNFEAF